MIDFISLILIDFLFLLSKKHGEKKNQVKEKKSEEKKK